MTRVARWRRGRRRPAFMLLLAGLIVVGVGAAVASPPRSASLDDLDGRTWVVVPKEAATQLLLVNGISGLIEGETTVDGAGAATSFIGSGDGHSLLAGADGLVLVDDAGQRAARLPEVPATAAVLGDQVLVVDAAEDRVSLRAVDGDAREPRIVEGAPPPAADAAPVVDRSGRGWYLGDRGGRAVAVAIDAQASVTEEPIDAGTTGLVIVDGAAHAVSPAGVREVGGTSTLEAAGPEGVVPQVAEATRGSWAVAEGSTVRGNDGTLAQDLGAPVVALAVWHGQVVALTASGAFLGEPGALAPVPDVGAEAALHRDGGLLWITTPETAVAVDRDHDLTILRVSDVDLSLCVGDCSAAAASRFLEENVTTTTVAPARTAGPAATTTTTTPRRLDAEVVPPTLANVTTTTAAARSTDASPPTTAAAAPTTLAPSAEPEVVATTVVTAPATTEAPPGNGNGPRPPADDKPPRGPGPLPLPLPLPTAPPQTTTTEGPPPEPEPEPEPEPGPAQIGLVYELRGGTLAAYASLQVLGSPRQCGEQGTRATATFTWRGSGSPRTHEVRWANREAESSEEQEPVTLAPVEPGELSVSVTVCGVTATRSTTVAGIVPPPTTAPPTTAPPATTTTTAPTTTRPPTTTTPTTTTPTVPTTPTTRPPTTTVPPTTTTVRPTTTTIRPTTTSGPPAP